MNRFFYIIINCLLDNKAYARIHSTLTQPEKPQSLLKINSKTALRV